MICVMTLNQIGILLQLSGTATIILVAGILLAPEIIGKEIPNYIIHALTRFASRLRDIIPQQSTARIKKTWQRVMLGLTLWFLLNLSIVFLFAFAETGDTYTLVIGVLAAILLIILIAWVTLLPMFSLKATKQRGTWDKGKFTPTERVHSIKISFLQRLKFAGPSFVVIILSLSLWPFWLLALLIFTLAFTWCSVMRFLATEKAPRIIALLTGSAVLLSGLIIEFIDAF